MFGTTGRRPIHKKDPRCSDAFETFADKCRCVHIEYNMRSLAPVHCLRNREILISILGHQGGLAFELILILLSALAGMRPHGVHRLVSDAAENLYTKSPNKVHLLFLFAFDAAH